MSTTIGNEQQAIAKSTYSFPDVSLFESQSWLKCIKDSYGYHFGQVEVAEGHSVPYAVVPQMYYKRVSVLPFSDYTSLHLKNHSENRLLFEKLKSTYPGSEIVLKMIADDFNSGTKLWGEVSRKAFVHRIPTAKPALSSSFVRGAKKASRHGVEMRCRQDDEALANFIEMYNQLRMKKFESLPQPRHFFENIKKHFIDQDKGFFLEASIHDKAIASMVVLKHERCWYYKFGCSDLGALQHRPNNLLFTKLIEMARENGIPFIDLGLSGAGDSYKGLRQFKEGMGGQAFPVVYYRHLPSSLKPLKERQDRFMKNLTASVAQGGASPRFTDTISRILYPYFG